MLEHALDAGAGSRLDVHERAAHASGDRQLVSRVAADPQAVLQVSSPEVQPAVDVRHVSGVDALGRVLRRDLQADVRPLARVGQRSQPVVGPAPAVLQVYVAGERELRGVVHGEVHVDAGDVVAGGSSPRHAHVLGCRPFHRAGRYVGHGDRGAHGRPEHVGVHVAHLDAGDVALLQVPPVGQRGGLCRLRYRAVAPDALGRHGAERPDEALGLVRQADQGVRVVPDLRPLRPAAARGVRVLGRDPCPRSRIVAENVDADGAVGERADQVVPLEAGDPGELGARRRGRDEDVVVPGLNGLRQGAEAVVLHHEEVVLQVDLVGLRERGFERVPSGRLLKDVDAAPLAEAGDPGLR